MRTTDPTDEEIQEAFNGTNFGPTSESIEGQRKLVASAIFRLVCDYGNGSTITRIVEELGMVSKKTGKPSIVALRWAYSEIMRRVL